MKYKKILITGSAGFIGYHLAKKISHEINKIIDFKPSYSLEDGLSNFFRWFNEYENFK